MATVSYDPSELIVSPDLLQKYDRPGPRYTSYPTAPEWSESFGADDYAQILAKADQEANEPLSLYFHLPFCWERCLFCGCNVIISKRPQIAEEYLTYLGKEMDLVLDLLPRRRKVTQLHWGGGTPTYLNPSQIAHLFDMITHHFQVQPEAEIAIEVDPRVTTDEQLQTLRRLGFNRLSMGVQDLDPHVQAVVNRNQTEEQTRRLFERCRELGFKGINIDLIYGLPEQRLETWENTLDTIIAIRPDRLAVYSYAHLPSRLKHQQKLEGRHIPLGAEKYALFALARKKFLRAGYRAIGMDHFALPTDELAVAMDERRLYRTFMGYTVVPAPDQIGFGVSAIGEIAGAYAQNEKRPAMYFKALREHRLPTHCGIRLTKDDEIRRWVIRQVMCNFYLDFAELKQRFGVNFEEYFAQECRELQEFVQDGFLVFHDRALQVLPLGQVFVRNICMVFDAYLRKPKAERLYSSTI